MHINQQEWGNALKGIYRGEIKFAVPMKNHTSLAIGGPADALAIPADPVSLKNVVLLSQEKKIPVFPFGGGTNILVRDSGIDGVAINLKSFSMINVISEKRDNVELFVEAGAPLQALVNFCKDKGYSGMEGLTGIPGTFGGAVCGNAGSYGCEIKDLVQSALIMSSDGKLNRLSAGDLGFGYRKSNLKPMDIVVNANILLHKDDKNAVAGRMRKYLSEKKKTQPISDRSAGCVFKNPEGVSAGKLIDEAGCKGMKLGGIEVSRIHANFFVNTGNGTAHDYTSLMNEVSLIVKKKYGIALEPEIRLAGRG